MSSTINNISELRDAVGIRSSGRSNGMGVAGFVVSLVGLVASCGLVSPIGLVMSLIGLRREPRGLAIAGVVLGVVGSIGFFVALSLGLFAAILAAVGIGVAAAGAHAVANEDSTHAAIASVQEAVVAYERGAGKPVYAVELLVPRYLSDAAVPDAWGHPLRFELTLENEYVVRSDGPDEVPETADDIEVRFPSEVRPAPAVRPVLEVVPPRQAL